MKKANKTYRSHCPINFSQEIFGDKWSLLIIRDLLFFGKKHYGDLLNSEEKISTNILADRLGKLEGSGLITRTVDKEHLSKKRYALTEKGRDLLPLLIEMIVWSAKYDNDTEAPPELIERLQDDKEALILELRSRSLEFDA